MVIKFLKMPIIISNKLKSRHNNRTLKQKKLVLINKLYI